MSVAERLWTILVSRVARRRRQTFAGDAGAAGWRAAEPPAAEPALDPTLAACYANLEIPYGSDLATVEAAWKRLMRRCHPDRHAVDPERQEIANELTKQLNHAYEQLRLAAATSLGGPGGEPSAGRLASAALPRRKRTHVGEIRAHQELSP